MSERDKPVLQQMPEGDFGIASAEELMRCSAISPQFIKERSLKIRPGFVAALDKKYLTEDDINCLVFPTKQWQYEVGFSFDAETDKFYYFIGNTHSARVTAEQYRIGHKIIRNTLIDVHTHPAWSFLLASPGDIDSFRMMANKSNILSEYMGIPKKIYLKV